MDCRNRTTARTLAAALAFFGVLGCGTAEAPGPNVVVIVIDTLRADRLPFYGGPRGTAPFLASLAENGLVFDNAWSTSSWTAPSTASIFTGLYPNEHGVRLGLRAGMRRQERGAGQALDRIPDELPTLASFMRSLGYRTFGATANPNIDERLGFERGFDRFAPYDREAKKSAERLVDKILGWRDEISEGPYFLYVHLADPHGPYQRHAEYIESTDPPPERNLDDLVAYDSEIRFADEQIRRLFRELDLGADTIVVVTADHGQEFMDHGQRGHGWQLYSELTRVPLLIHYPADGRIRGRVATNVSNADIAATLQDLVGSTGDGAPAGRSLLERTGSGRGAEPVFAMRKHDDGVAPPGYLHAVVSGRYKLIAHQPEGRLELYDLEADPEEQSDIAAAHPEIVERLGAEMIAQQAAAAETGLHSGTRFEPTPDMTELLEELGYVEGGPNLGP